MKYKKICKNPKCNKEFESNILAQRYCCSACKSAIESARQKEKNEMELGKFKKCKMCGKTFKASKTLRSFCSYECRAYYNKVPDGKYEYECECCHKMFVTAVENKKFCSERCRMIGKKTKKIGIEEIAKRSREEGITYGQYVAKYGI